MTVQASKSQKKTSGIWKPRKKLVAGVDPIAWAYKNRKARNLPLDHRTQPYQLEPLFEGSVALEEEGARMTFLSGRQVGKTAMLMTLGFWYLDIYGGSVIHAVPTQANADRLNSTILLPALHDTEFQNIEADSFFNRSVKTFKGKHSASYLSGHTLGGNVTSSGDNWRGLTSGLILLDERGQMPEEAVAVIESCADTFSAPLILEFGSAGYKGDSLDRSFTFGDRREWAIPCECGKHTILAPYGSLIDDVLNCYGKDDTGYFYRCEHCGRPVDPLRGFWTVQDGRYPSYHLSSMNSRFFTAQKLHERIQNPNTTEESLMREVAGLPYGGEGVTITANDVKVEPVPINLRTTAAAVDWGSQSSWLVLKANNDKCWVAACGKVEGTHDAHVPELYKQIKEFHPEYVAADFGFEGGRNDKLNQLTGNTYTMMTNLSPRPGTVYEQVIREPRTYTYRVARSWVWERIVEDLKAGVLVLGEGMEEVRDDILAVAPQKAGKGTREWISYEMTRQHYAACLMMAYAIHLRENMKRRHSSVGYGNPMAFPAHR